MRNHFSIHFIILFSHTRAKTKLLMPHYHGLLIKENSPLDATRKSSNWNLYTLRETLCIRNANKFKTWFILDYFPLGYQEKWKEEKTFPFFYSFIFLSVKCMRCELKFEISKQIAEIGIVDNSIDTFVCVEFG